MSRRSLPSESEVLCARAWLAEFVVSQATATAEHVGFGWEVSPDAPDSFEKLKVEFVECTVSGHPLRVAAVNADPSIFASASVTYALRFWHDVTHVEMDAGFGFGGEMRVAEAHLQLVVEAGRCEGSLAWRLMQADTVGQNYVFAMTDGGFVADQLAFALTAVTVGLPFAVLQAVEQTEQRQICAGDTDILLGLMETAR